MQTKIRKLKAVLLGAGNRGMIYADYALSFPERLEIVAVVDTDKTHRDEAKIKYSLSSDVTFSEIDDFLKAKIAADFVINATMDAAHYGTTMKLIAAGYSILLEKPVTNCKKELLEIQQAANVRGIKIIVCHVLRYTPFYRTIKELIVSGAIGRVLTMELNEHVEISHFLDSFVRGKWSNEKECGSSFLLQKSCHDTDLICWLHNEAEPKNVSSFGSRSLFVPQNAPKGATEFCYNCPHNNVCLYSAQKVHLELDRMPFQTWEGLEKPIDKITREEKEEYLKHSRYGKCAYNSGGDINDRQIVNIEFTDGVTACFTMVGGASRGGREIFIVGDKGEITGFLEDDKFILRKFRREPDYGYDEEIIDVKSRIANHTENATHSGGDCVLMQDAVNYFDNGTKSVSITDINDSVNGHCLVYVAEEARKENKIVDFSGFKDN